MGDRRATEDSVHRSGSVTTRARAFSVLGLEPDAGVERVRGAYRRLAFELHPDRNRSTPQDEAAFRRITCAYRLILSGDRLRGTDCVAGECAKCGREAALHLGLDRNAYCRDCLLTIDGRRGLPAPPIVFATFGLAMAALLGSCVALAIFIYTGRAIFGWVSLALSAFAFVFIAFTAIVVGRVDTRKKVQNGEAT